MTNETLKYIVTELNKEPFTMNHNMVTFSKLQPVALLQVLNDVFAAVDPKQKVDIREEIPDQMVIRILGMLQILKYKPTNIEDPSIFRQGLVKGDPNTLYPILQYLLQRLPDLKKRAYLARYLVKLDVPLEIKSDVDIADLFDQYDQTIEEFKATHKEWENGKNFEETASELRRDLEAMEEERDVLVKRVEKLQRKVEHMPNRDAMLTLAKSLRLEKDRARDLMQHKAEQKQQAFRSEQRIQHLTQQLRDLRNANNGATAEGLFQRLEDEMRVHTYIVQEKLPKEMATKQKLVAILEEVLASPAPRATDTEELQQKVQVLNLEMSRVAEKRALEADPTEDKMTLFRQQAAIVARKKECAAERLSEARLEVQSLEAELKNKREQLADMGSETLLSGDDFKNYVSDLRNKSNAYKQKRAELNDLKAEYGILSRTLEILKGQEEAAKRNLSLLEAQKGVIGFRNTQEELERVSSDKAATDEEKGRTLEQMSVAVRILISRIGEQKATLAPILKELRPLRQRYQEVSVDYDARKQAFQAMIATVESNVAKIEQEKKSLEDEVGNLESKRDQLELSLETSQKHMERAAEEVKLYISGQEKGNSLREKLHAQITEQEKLANELKEDQRELKVNLPKLTAQVKLWNDLAEIFEAKRQYMEKQKNQTRLVRESGTETLVFN